MVFLSKFANQYLELKIIHFFLREFRFTNSIYPPVYICFDFFIWYTEYKTLLQKLSYIFHYFFICCDQQNHITMNKLETKIEVQFEVTLKNRLIFFLFRWNFTLKTKHNTYFGHSNANHINFCIRGHIYNKDCKLNEINAKIWFEFEYIRNLIVMWSNNW